MRVIGQGRGCKSRSEAILRARAGLKMRIVSWVIYILGTLQGVGR